MSIEERGPFEPSPSPPRRPTPPDRSPAYVCWAIIALSVAAFGYEKFVVGQYIGPLYGPAIHKEPWRLFTHVFEHSLGNPLHLLFNMSVVYTLGMTLERAIGHVRFAVISIITALGSATFALAFAYDSGMVGASGMILGWAGTILPISTEQGRRSLGTWLVQVAIISLLPGVSWQGHLGGFLYGLPCGLSLRGGRKSFWVVAPLLIAGAFATAWIASDPSLHHAARAR